jgi:hypothetical protein
VSRGLLAALAALLCLSRPGASPGQAGEPPGRALDIAPMEADIEAMRRTLRSLETLVDERASDRVDDLISPRATPARRRGITQAVEGQIRSLPEKARFSLRSDIGQGAIVPIGPERVQVQVSSTIGAGASRRTGRIDLELEAVEQGGRRRWLLIDAVFPGQRPLVTGGFPAGPVAALAAVIALPLLATAAWWLWRRRARRAGRDVVRT